MDDRRHDVAVAVVAGSVKLPRRSRLLFFGCVLFTVSPHIMLLQKLLRRPPLLTPPRVGELNSSGVK